MRLLAHGFSVSPERLAVPANGGASIDATFVAALEDRGPRTGELLVAREDGETVANVALRANVVEGTPR